MAEDMSHEPVGFMGEMFRDLQFQWATVRRVLES